MSSMPTCDCMVCLRTDADVRGTECLNLHDSLTQLVAWEEVAGASRSLLNQAPRDAVGGIQGGVKTVACESLGAVIQSCRWFPMLRTVMETRDSPARRLMTCVVLLCLQWGSGWAWRAWWLRRRSGPRAMVRGGGGDATVLTTCAALVITGCRATL
jgi:hypothetical protein